VSRHEPSKTRNSCSRRAAGASRATGAADGQGMLDSRRVQCRCLGRGLSESIGFSIRVFWFLYPSHSVSLSESSASLSESIGFSDESNPKLLATRSCCQLSSHDLRAHAFYRTLIQIPPLGDMYVLNPLSLDSEDRPSPNLARLLGTRSVWSGKHLAQPTREQSEPTCLSPCGRVLYPHRGLPAHAVWRPTRRPRPHRRSACRVVPCQGPAAAPRRRAVATLNKPRAGLHASHCETAHAKSDPVIALPHGAGIVSHAQQMKQLSIVVHILNQAAQTPFRSLQLGLAPENTLSSLLTAPHKTCELTPCPRQAHSFPRACPTSRGPAGSARRRAGLLRGCQVLQ
jgi:hypothetical protein